MWTLGVPRLQRPWPLDPRSTVLAGSDDGAVQAAVGFWFLVSRLATYMWCCYALLVSEMPRWAPLLMRRALGLDADDVSLKLGDRVCK